MKMKASDKKESIAIVRAAIGEEETDLKPRVRKGERHRSMIEEMERNLRAAANQRIKVIVPYLAERGWYFYMTLPATFSEALKQLIDEGAHDKVEELMISFAMEHAGGIRKRVQRDWPRRAKILDDAFDAHDNRLFTLSIPTMLAQGDGVCAEMFQGLHFVRKEWPKIKQELGKYRAFKEIPDPILELLHADMAVNEHTDERKRKRQNDPKYGAFNRNGILHGMDLDYPTEPNSFRAIVFLGYLQEMQIRFNARKQANAEIEAILKAYGTKI